MSVVLYAFIYSGTDFKIIGFLSHHFLAFFMITESRCFQYKFYGFFALILFIPFIFRSINLFGLLFRSMYYFVFNLFCSENALLIGFQTRS